MFTGIVQTKAVITQIRDEVALRRLTIKLGAEFLRDLNRGASIAINGVCLTVTDFDSAAGWVNFDVITETLAKTNLGKLIVGDDVNLSARLHLAVNLEAILYLAISRLQRILWLYTDRAMIALCSWHWLRSICVMCLAKVLLLWKVAA
jgi:hypothetical protein